MNDHVGWGIDGRCVWCGTDDAADKCAPMIALETPPGCACGPDGDCPRCDPPLTPEERVAREYADGLHIDEQRERLIEEDDE